MSEPEEPETDNESISSAETEETEDETIPCYHCGEEVLEYLLVEEQGIGVCVECFQEYYSNNQEEPFILFQ